MKHLVYNPYLPLDEYIADGEPHVFDDRIYLFGSHDQENGSTYCMLDYVFWSAPVNDLSDWSNKGISYSAVQDPDYSDTLKYMYAPDVVRGNDGRYYLYYCLSGEKGQGGYGRPISVAVCDTPDGKYEYLGFVRDPDGSPLRRYITFDPALINDAGTIRLYYGTWYPFHEYRLMPESVCHKIESRLFQRPVSEIASYEEGIMGPVHVELADDMLTVCSKPRRILPFHVKGTSFAQHPFFEASSIRKIGNLYYFIYSSLHGHELCYALSRYPDRDFEYAGVIVSNGDIGIKGRKARDRLNTTGTNHGSIEQINGRWYVFYHRNTNRTAYSRQACAEPIFISTNGFIQQAEITSSGLNGASFPTEGRYPAAVCCNLTNGRMPHQGNGVIHKNIPYIRGRDGECTVIAVNNTRITYKYFLFPVTQTELKILLRSQVSGKLMVYVSGQEEPVGIIDVKPADDWRTYRVLCGIGGGTRSLTLLYQGKGSVELREFELRPADQVRRKAGQ